ncbi:MULTISPECIES: metal ABC transporter permease [unclassified Coleofasciculus]|uniref:metal ABC transporter permease n=1 Tax=unclassified Coleofasciculus TaxID=2692782 RepID=UPI0018827F70|nr:MULTISPECIES: metal ABC transporter permease [unclassified Coleofasciculus]MBE9128060.1 metal ABC transporter permease [Coleofasciculus sp. LEGE 07081]MBE9149337.1 metal ABC transporter permease [Coleofasciculus sp. LEGE 07092]
MIAWLIEPLSFEFMRNAIATAVLLGILSAVVGSYLIVQQMSMIAAEISHAVVPGLSIAFFFGEQYLSLGAFISGTLSALLVAGIHKRSRIKLDAAMALILSSFLALGVILISLLKTNQTDLNSILFGDILGVRPSDVWQTLVITVVILLLTKVFYKELLFYTFDPLGAQASGLPVTSMYLGLVCAITLTIVGSMQTVGVLLVIALLVGPATTAYLLVKELHHMMGLGAVIGIISGIGGMYLSYHFDLPSGPAIVLVIFGFFVLAFLLSPTQGILTEPGTVKWVAKILEQLKGSRE